MGSTVAHDAHNVVVVGTNDADICRAIQALEQLQGGQVAVRKGRVTAELGLPVAGLVSDRSLEEVIAAPGRAQRRGPRPWAANWRRRS